jgi:hypothetical protein
MNLYQHIEAGVVYEVELVRKGQVIARERVHNLMPTEGLNHLISVGVKGGTQIGTWYIGLFEGNYTPLATDTAAAFPAAATECTAYDETTREEFVDGAAAAGAVNNSASKAEFTLNASKTLYGAFMASAPAKGATTGVLLSAARFASPKAGEAGDIIRVTGGLTLANPA